MIRSIPSSRFPAISSLARGARASIAGTSIVEAVVAGALITLGFGGLFQITARSFSSLRVQTETARAAQVFQERIDYLRAQPWGVLANGANYANYNYTITDPVTGTTTTETWKGILNTLPASAGMLGSPIETVTFAAYGATGTPPAPFTVKNQNGTVTVTPTGGTNLSAQSMIRVDTRIEWKEGRTARTRAQETSFVISQKGVGK